jgi:hypothetical protein
MGICLTTEPSTMGSATGVSAESSKLSPMLNSVSIVMQTSIGFRIFMRFSRYSSRAVLPRQPALKFRC